jgi:cation:H+ antiporter
MLDILAVIAGLVILTLGGEGLVRGSTAIARRLNIAPAIIGATVVAAGTSMPELVVSVSAAFQGSPDVAVSNAVGSNIYNIVLILGLTPLILPLAVQGVTIRLQWPVMLLAAAWLHMLARDGMLDRLEGGFLLLGLVVFVAWTVRLARDVAPQHEKETFGSVAERVPMAETLRSWMWSVGGIVVGVALLVLGAKLLVSGAVNIASDMGISERVIGLTVVAVGTCLPELATSIIAALHGRADLAVANVVGSNIFNILGILGATAVAHPMRVSQGTIDVDDWWMLALTLLLLPLMKTGKIISRVEGGFLLALGVGWTVWLFLA